MDKEIVPPSPLSFDTSLIKFFCKTPETEKANTLSKRSSMKTEKKPEKIQIEKTSHGRFLFETDPSFEDISIDLIKTMGNEETKLSKEKFDGSILIMNLKDKEIYSDLNEPEEKKACNLFQTPFSTNISTPFTTPRVNESFFQKNQTNVINSQPQPYKNLSFISNDSNTSSNIIVNQSETNNNSNNSRRNTNENIFNQDYSNFFNDWRTIHYFQQGKQTPIHHKKSGYENFQEIDKTPQNQRNSGYDMKSFDIDLNRVQEDGRTTVMIKNIPNKYDKNMLMKEINMKFKEKYDFFYLPIDFTNRCNVGYAFINFVSSNIIRDFYLEFNGKRWEKFNSEKICLLTYGRIQGKKNLTHHFENSTVMKQPDIKLKPVILLAKAELNNIQSLVEKQKENVF